MNQCHGSEKAQPVSACCGSTPVEAVAADSCCEPRARIDWMLWGSLSIVACAYGLGALQSGHVHSDSFAVFNAGVFELFNRMWWGIAIGVVFVGLLSRVPRELVMGVLGRNGGLGGMFRATLAGVFLDLCSHGILAVGMKLYERGAGIGQVMAFLLASPWNSLSLTLILLGLIGVGWTLLFIALSLVIGIVTGLIFEALVSRGRLPENPYRELLQEDERPLTDLWQEFRDTITFSGSGTVGILREGIRGSRIVIRWAMFGLVLAALIRAFVPEDNYANWFGATFAGLWLTLAAATIIEVCSEGATPIAADLMNRASAPGNSFTFLMAGVATDYTEVMSIKDTTQSWKIAFFLPLIAVPQIVLLGFVLNNV
ncbi:MAG: permease [Pseudomonadota bacterium]